MKDNLIKWAQAGDGDCAYKLAKLYLAEENLQEYEQWLAKATETKNFDAMKEYAEVLQGAGDYEKALAIYRELAEKFCDEESMEKMVDMCERGYCDKDTLNFILGIINEQFNDIYSINSGNVLGRIWTFQTRRHDECTLDYLRGVERRKIASRIRKLLAKD